MTDTPKVLLHWDEDGEFSWAATTGVDVVAVDERCINDRVYRSTDDASRPPLAALNMVIDGRARHPIDAIDMLDGRIPQASEPSQ